MLCLLLLKSVGGFKIFNFKKIYKQNQGKLHLQTVSFAVLVKVFTVSSMLEILDNTVDML